MLTKTKIPTKCVTLPQMNLIFGSRIFWRQLATWTRAYFISNLKGHGNVQSIYAYLFNLPDEFTAMLRLVFGGETAEGYCELLEKHMLLLRDMVSAQMSGDTEAVNKAVALLYQNADERATFLAAPNPFWSESAWRNYMNLYVRYTIEEANAFVTENYEMNIDVFDRLTTHTNDMGYYFSQGIFNYITYNAPAGQNPHMVQSARQNSRYHRTRYQDQCFTFEQMNTIFNIRMFWYELSVWLRIYMDSRYMGLDASEKVMARLKRVPINYTNQLKRFFGEKVTNQYLQLLNTYIDLISDLITAQQSGNTEKTKEIILQLYHNVDQRAAILATINPFFDANELKRMLYSYTRSTIRETETYLSQDSISNIIILNRLITHTDEIGEYFSRNLFNYLSYLPDK
jgi:hypothetical protein